MSARRANEIVVGAMTSHHDVTRDDILRQHVALIQEATKTVADPQVRHRGTLGGALAHADPAGDLAAPALALEAEFVIAGENGTRTVAAADFFEDYFTTAIGDGELLTEIRFPKYTGWGARYEKFNRVAQAWSIVAVAATIKVDGGTISDARIGLTNMAGTPVRARAVESALVGQSATEDNVAQGRPGGRRGHQPHRGRGRRYRLPRAPRQGAHRSGRPRRCGLSPPRSTTVRRSARHDAPARPRTSGGGPPS